MEVNHFVGSFVVLCCNNNNLYRLYFAGVPDTYNTLFSLIYKWLLKGKKYEMKQEGKEEREALDRFFSIAISCSPFSPPWFEVLAETNAETDLVGYYCHWFR